MVNTWADKVDTLVNDQPMVLSEEGQGMRTHTPRTQPPAPAPGPHSAEPRPQPCTPETDPLSGLEHLVRVTPQKPHPAVPPLQEADAATNTSDVDVEQQLLIELAGGDSLPDVLLPNVPLPNVPLPNVPLPNVPLPNVPLRSIPLAEARPDGLVCEE